MTKTLMTLCLIYTPTHVLLGMKNPKKFGGGRWNGYGGKFDASKGDKTITDTAIREVKEETEINLRAVIERGIIEFHFENKPDEVYEVHLYSLNAWNGEPKANEEMIEHKWFLHNEVPYDSKTPEGKNLMWPADKYWMPYVLAGRNVYGKVHFKDINAILSQEIRFD